ncbi:MAG: hypothetical protein QF416_06305, partial [Candidatus Marinimicrobia bacterium]|nr:hypothetical protein [Candidatus Neomarinimicrobiota bacterium]
MIKSINTAAILTMIITLPSLALSQSIDLKGQLWGGGILGDDPAEGRSSVETQLGYIPTISFYLPLNDERLLDMEWAYRVSRAYSGEALLASAEKPYR